MILPRISKSIGLIGSLFALRYISTSRFILYILIFTCPIFTRFSTGNSCDSNYQPLKNPTLTNPPNHIHQNEDVFSVSKRVMACSANQGNPETAQSVYEFSVNDIKGEPVSLEKYRGHVLIIVNVASKCGYTAKHYAELNEIYDQYAESKGLRILAFPCNQFNNQEPGNAEEIQCFLKDRKVKFDLFEKIDVNGKNAHPLWQYLKKEQGGTLFDAIKWNFTKFVVDKDGKPVGRHSPNTSPMEMLKDVEKYF